MYKLWYPPKAFFFFFSFAINQDALDGSAAYHQKSTGVKSCSWEILTRRIAVGGKLRRPGEGRKEPTLSVTGQVTSSLKIWNPGPIRQSAKLDVAVISALPGFWQRLGL
jgi:hypothetical protein